MTDNRTTELRELLDRFASDLCEVSCVIKCDTHSERKKLRDDMKDRYAQAIAATLGSERGTCHAESDLSEWVCSNCQCWIPLGLTPENIMHASEWRYCPHCGAKVKAVSNNER